MTAFLTPTQVAEELACSPDSVLRAITRGDLPAVKYGRLVRVSRDDLDRFLEQHKTQGRNRRLRRTA